MKPLAPQTLLQDRYLITNIIGKGGMGEVYLATDTRLGNKVALKRTTVGDDEMLAIAFENEARTLAGLRHPVLPAVSDHFLEDDEQFLVMDYISGQDLGQSLKDRNQPFPLNWVLYWADQLLDALAYLHTHEPPIIHRDIKPQNLKLTGENQIVLLDFGLSKNSVGQTRVTTSGSVVGYTPHYAPMEQIRGTGTNAKSDLYALSATLYQLLTNTVPPDALTRADSLLGNLPDPLRPLSEINTELSESISETIMKGMDISQDRRFESAREMQKELRRAYNRMKASMSADTVAFNVEQSLEPPAEEVPSEAKTEVNIDIPMMPVPPVEPVSRPVEPPAPVAEAGEDISAEKTEVFDPADFEAPQPEPDPTLPAGAILPDVLGSEPIGEKTDVLLDHVFPESTTNKLPPETPPDEPPEAPSGFETADDFSTAEDFDAGGFESAPSAVPDETVQVINTDGMETGVSDFSVTEEEDFDEDQSYTTAAGAAAAAGQSAVSEEEAEIDKAAPVERKKSSTGKYVAILGGIAALLILVVGSVAAGLWYLSSTGGNGTGDVGLETTPSVEESVEPTVETTIEQVLPPEETPEDGNINSNQEDPAANDSPEITVPTSTPGSRSTPSRSTPRKTPVTRKTPVRRKTPRRTTPKPTRKTVKKTPKKKDPGVL